MTIFAVSYSARIESAIEPMKKLFTLFILIPLCEFASAQITERAFGYEDGIVNTHPVYIKPNHNYRIVNWDSIATESKVATDDYYRLRIDSLENELLEIKNLLISGLKAIRHDAIIRCKFRYAKKIKGEILKLEKETITNK